MIGLVEDQGVADFDGLEVVLGDAAELEFGAQEVAGFENGFDGELEGAPVVAAGEGGAAFGEAFGFKTATICGRASV